MTSLTGERKTKRMKDSETPHLYLKDRVAGDQWIGQRERQEDNFLVIDLRDDGHNEDDAVLCILADGMGGAVGGSIASKIAVDTFADAYLNAPKSQSPGERLSAALSEVTSALQQRISVEPSLKGMGCTLVAALIEEDSVRWISVGDSPFWLHRNHSLTQLNKDHSMKPVLDALVEKGELTRDEADRDGRRNALRSAIDGNEPQLIDLQDGGYQLQPGDVLILASDGLETLKVKQIEKILDQHRYSPVIERVEKLLLATSKANDPYQDNTTVILMDAVMSEKGMKAIANPTRRGDGISVPASTVRLRETTTTPSESRNPLKSGAGRSSVIVFGLASLLFLAFLLLLFLRFGDGNEAQDTLPDRQIHPSDTQLDESDLDSSKLGRSPFVEEEVGDNASDGKANGESFVEEPMEQPKNPDTPDPNLKVIPDDETRDEGPGANADGVEEDTDLDSEKGTEQ